MDTKIGILRSQQAGCYLIINDRGIPRTAKGWQEAVLALRALTLEPNSAIEALKPEIDAGKMMHLRPRSRDTNRFGRSEFPIHKGHRPE